MLYTGQNLPTRIVRFITPDSIEGAVLELQASKPSSGLSLLNATATAAANSSASKAKGGRGGGGGSDAVAAEVEFQDMLKVVKTMLAGRQRAEDDRAAAGSSGRR